MTARFVEKQPLVERECRKRVKLLAKVLPTRKPIRLTFIYNDPKPKEYAWIEETQRSFRIYLHMRCCRACVVSSLDHEYAHALSWEGTGGMKRDHGAHDQYFWTAFCDLYSYLPDDYDHSGLVHTVEAF